MTVKLDNSKMILIRADANEQIGSGHIMRCLTVAHALAMRGKDVRFITADHKADNLISRGGFSSICLESAWSDMENEGIETIVEQYRPEWVIIDSYYVTEQYMETLNAITRTAYFDDMNRNRWCVDILINYNIIAKVFDYSWYQNTKTRLLLYPQYAPLRDEFINIPQHQMKDVNNILVSAGGSDPEKITETLMKSVTVKFPRITFHLIVGMLNPRIREIEEKAKLQENITLHINEQHMSELMKKCDIAISAAGFTLYELCACGIPTITYALADNQLVATEQFDKQGIMLSAGDCRGNNQFIGRIERLLTDLISDERKRASLSNRMRTLVDGNGARRIVDELLFSPQ